MYYNGNGQNVREPLFKSSHRKLPFSKGSFLKKDIYIYINIYICQVKRQRDEHERSKKSGNQMSLEDFLGLSLTAADNGTLSMLLPVSLED